jgi:hypothetical protein
MVSEKVVTPVNPGSGPGKAPESRVSIITRKYRIPASAGMKEIRALDETIIPLKIKRIYKKEEGLSRVVGGRKKVKIFIDKY